MTNRKALTKRQTVTVATTALDLIAIAAVTFGAWLIYAPVGFIVGGLLLAVLSWRVSA